jgi:hypothetical protein
MLGEFVIAVSIFGSLAATLRTPGVDAAVHAATPSSAPFAAT